MSDNLELAKKALNYVKERRWDYLLVHTFLAVKHYPSWSENADFEERTNIGLKDISSKKRLLVCKYLKKETEFVKATYKDIVFEIGGFSHSSSMPDGEYFVTFACSLLIDEKVALTAMYSERDMDAYFAKDFSISAVEELHVDKKIDELLVGIESLIAQREIREKERQTKMENQKYEGKFTFGEE